MPTRKANIENTSNTKFGTDVDAGTLLHCWWQCKLAATTWEDCLLMFIKAIHVFLMSLREMSIYVHQKTVTRKIIIAFFVIVPNYKQHSCLSTRKGINKLLYIHKMLWNTIQQ